MHTDQATIRLPVAGAASRSFAVAGTATILLGLLAGCGNYKAAPPAAPPQPKAAAPQPAATAPAVETPKPAVTAAPAPQKPAETVQTKAEVGVGAKGHYDGLGVVTTPVSVFFRAQERIAFEIQVPKAMQLFKATEGRAPKSNEEFMQRIIKENMIKLPELNPDERYIYDPKTEQLMVEQPRR